MADPAPPPQRFSEGFPGHQPHGAPHCGCATARHAHRSRDAAHYDKGAPGSRHVAGGWLRPFLPAGGAPPCGTSPPAVNAAPRHVPRGRPPHLRRWWKRLKKLWQLCTERVRVSKRAAETQMSEWRSNRAAPPAVGCVRRSDGGSGRKQISNGLFSKGGTDGGLLGCTRTDD